MRRTVLVVVALCGCSLAPAGVVTLQPIRDNTLFDYADPTSNGAGKYCFVGMTAEPTRRRALMTFDVQGAIPADARVRSVILGLNMSKTISGPSDVALHRLTTDWGEGASDATGEEGAGAPAQPGDATWVHNFYDTYYWSQRGGDFAASASATTSVAGDGPYTWTSAGMLADVIDWQSGAAPNFGWILLGDESGEASAKRFDTREHPDPARRPQLVIAFTPPCAADWNMDGAVDTRDVLAFLNEWAGGYLSADINLDGAVDTRDVLAFLNAWNTGCP